jgi:intraflagellar transport protein 140
MLFYEERSRLVIITRSLLLTQYQVAEDGRVTRVMQVKMSVAGDVAEKGLKSVVWASPGLIAAATQEKMVRLLDIAADESYNLSLSACGDIVDRSDRVVTVVFGPLDRYLAVGTQGGVVAVWKFNGPIRDVSGARSTVIATSSSDWEVRRASIEDHSQLAYHSISIQSIFHSLFISHDVNSVTAFCYA